MLKAYYSVLKPERTYANVMTATAGLLFACKWHIDWGLFVATLLGTTFVVMSACAANNCTDRGIDAHMSRTKKRALVTKALPVRNVAALAVVLGLAGFSLLIAYVNGLTVLIGAIAYIDYVVLYAWSKRHSVHSTLVGTLSGAAPLVAGYTAVTNRFNATAVTLGLIMVFWQMAHFYAIGVFRRDDYAAAGLPILPVKKGLKNTQQWILAYTVLYVLATLGLVFSSPVSVIYMLVVGLIGTYWLYKGMKGFRSVAPEKWARGMFGISLLVLLAFSAVITLAPVLPG